MTTRGHLHHLEIWLREAPSPDSGLPWLLAELGYRREQTWGSGESWHLGGSYVVLESGPDVVDTPHERTRPGMNHVAFFAGTPAEVEALAASATGHGFTLMFPDRHPFAGGPDHYAAYLEDEAGFEVELVAHPYAPAAARPEG
ncbi:glyoxalase [Xylanimonas oleitrophica]|uniref:Glyoxalase n=1 Tax=Xylanimonas oleitrophica TaxID=2607479 RepID=A0A2W5WP23_9MICO|nr:VOC family protein [Xylanimonas oleitrophica]PZR53117.1 glyoxalase [Xylanimonas oleitrophica]